MKATNTITQNNINSQSSPHCYRTEIPNIILSLGLSPYELALYAAYKRVAGDNGVCWQSNKELAKTCGMSVRKLIEVKKALCIPRKELKGKPLIQIQERIYENGQRKTDMIFIVDIWDENKQKMISDKKKENEKKIIIRPKLFRVVYSETGGVHDEIEEVKECDLRVVHKKQDGVVRKSQKEDLFKKNKEEERVSHPAERLACLLFDKIREHDPKHRIPNLKTWASDIEKLFRLDKRTEEEVESVICWVMKDDFWCKNILSGFKLRKKFDQLFLNKAKEKKSPQKLEEEKAKLKMQKRQKNKDWAEKVFKKKLESKEGSMEYLSNGVRVTYRNGWQIIPFTENGFQDQMKKYYMQIRG